MNDDNDTIHIRLCENEDVQTYNKAYAKEIDRVEEICGNAVQETHNSLVLVDIITEQDNKGKGKEEHDKEGKEEELDNGINDPHDSIILVDMNDSSTFNANQRQFIALDNDEITLHKTNSNSLKGKESTKHCFHIQDDDEIIMLKSLSVTIVYSGTFDCATYNPGVLTVELKQVSKDCSSSIGHSPPELQRLNTESQLGCLVVQYEQEETVINGGMFQVVVTADDNDVNYSITLGARLACPFTIEVKRRLARVVATRNHITECKSQVSVLDKQLILFERKRHLEDELINKSRDKSIKFLAEAEKLDLELEWFWRLNAFLDAALASIGIIYY